MIKVAIVGNIASGKSVVEDYIRQFYPVIDTDKIAHKILDTHYHEIKQEFRNYDICENEKICRKKLGKIVFENQKLKQKLENFIHPKINEEIEKFFEQNKSSKFVFVSVPLLFEAGFEDIFDKIIFIYADDKIRLTRLMKRNNLTEHEALLRMNAQISQEKKIEKCDFVIKNEKDLKNLHDELQKVLEKL